MQSGQGEAVLDIEDAGELSVKDPLVEKALNAHLAHEPGGWLEADSDLLPAPRFQAELLQLFIWASHVLDVSAVEGVDLNDSSAGLVHNYGDPVIDNAEETDKD